MESAEVYMLARWKIGVCCLLGILGCASDQRPRGALDEAGGGGLLCDGSDDVKLLYQVAGGGPLSRWFEFTNPVGHQFFWLDGRCRFFVGADHLDGFRSGTLDHDMAAELATAFSIEDLARWSSFADLPCPDGPQTSLRRAGSAAQCSCGCDADAPAGLADALQSAIAWYERFRDDGEPLSGALRVAAERADAPTTGRQAAVWPVSLRLSQIAVTPDAKVSASTGVLLSDDAETSQLRALRSAASQQLSPAGVLVEQEDALYLVYIRDEFPADAERALMQFRARTK